MNTEKVVGYAVSLGLLFVAFYVASRAWKAGQSAGAVTTPEVTKEKVTGYIVALLMLGVAIWVVSAAWKSGQSTQAAAV